MDELLNFVEKSLSTAVGGKDCPQPRCSARGLRGSPGADGSPAFPLRRFPGLGVTVPSAAVVTGNTLVFSFHASLVLVSDAGISLIFLFFQLFIFHLPNVLPYHLVLLYLSLVLISGSCLLLWYLVDSPVFICLFAWKNAQDLLLSTIFWAILSGTERV